MPSQRDTIIAAAVTALSAGSPSFTVSRFPVLPVQPETVPLMGVTSESETVELAGHRMNDGCSRFLTLVVSCWAKNGTSPDNALDTMVTHAVQKLIPVGSDGQPDETLGGTSATIDELGTNWYAEIQDHVYERADVRFRIRYHTKRTDPATKVG